MRPASSRGLLIVLSAASGAGKSTLCHRLLKCRPDVMFSVSVTTRMPRSGERDGRDYFFVSEAAFHAMRRRGDLLEWAKVHDHYYGTPRGFLDKTLRSGRTMLLDIDVQGAMQVKKRFPEAVLVFITTPSFNDLERRLRGRRSESEAQIRRRLADARRELKHLPRYDYHLVNDRVPDACERLNAILTAEAMRIRQPN
jgi:guanylate kinase